MQLVETQEPQAQAQADPLEERLFRKTIRQHIREFVCVFGIIFLAIGGYMVWRGYSPVAALSFLTLGVAFPVAGYTAPSLVRPLWSGWMAFAHKLGLVVNLIILSVAWVLLFIPMSLVLKIFRIKVMDTSFDRARTSYWEDRNIKYNDFSLLERQF